MTDTPLAPTAPPSEPAIDEYAICRAEARYAHGEARRWRVVLPPIPALSPLWWSALATVATEELD